ncbi:hypothetical protein GXM_05387 [Nostoc sphaeroides CCNUC1]|uniref:Uncharacterized protein n=1 Tax=Nostoc sphaeroides CCNUC1 TaxID=2653204 RepID=A0A5P8W577_9NOSO|nr:hypothetical protein GXM_05387 [Nostoc sphaeroides CCNUC1]
MSSENFSKFKNWALGIPSTSLRASGHWASLRLRSGQVGIGH